MPGPDDTDRERIMEGADDDRRRLQEEALAAERAELKARLAQIGDAFPPPNDLEAVRRRLAELDLEDAEARDEHPLAVRTRIDALVACGMNADEAERQVLDQDARGLIPPDDEVLEQARRNLDAARPLAELARERLRRLVEGMAEPLPAEELRDGAIAVAALTSAIAELEAIDGRAVVDRAVLERWADAVAELLELVGTPPERGREAGGPYWRVREDVLDELDGFALPPGQRRALNAGAGGGLWARLDRALGDVERLEEARRHALEATDDRLREELENRRRHFGTALRELRALASRDGTRAMLDLLGRMEVTFHAGADLPALEPEPVDPPAA